MNNIKNNNKKGIGIYVHIPFCAKKCNYCDFNSFNGSERDYNNYFDALSKEILQLKQRF